MGREIHPSSVVDPLAELPDQIEIGPFCVVGAGVRLGEGCRLISHVAIQGPTKIGERNLFYPFCSVGGRTQDLKYRGEPTFLEIGSDNCFREGVTINRGTGPDEKTVMGSGNNLLAYAHVAHNCTVGDGCIFSNNGTLAGHVVVEDYAIIGGLSAVHQFCRIGTRSMIGGCTKIVQDVPPFMVADGNPAQIRAINQVGLERSGCDPETIKTLRRAFKILFDSSLNTTQAVTRLQEEFQGCAEINRLVAFVQSSHRGIIR